MSLAAWLVIAGAAFVLPGARDIPVYWSDFPGSPGTAGIYCNLPVFGEGTHAFLCDGYPDGSVIINGPLFDAVVDRRMGNVTTARYPAELVKMIRKIEEGRLLRLYLCHEYAHHVLGLGEGETEWERHQEERAYAFGSSCVNNRPAWDVLR